MVAKRQVIKFPAKKSACKNHVESQVKHKPCNVLTKIFNTQYGIQDNQTFINTYMQGGPKVGLQLTH